jgi:S-formylglutathione hydrolase FrmB
MAPATPAASAALLPLPLPLPLPSPVCTPRATPVTTGLALTGTKVLSPRTNELTFASRAMNGPGRALVTLPASYAANPTRRYPVLYLLHGHGGGGPLDWFRHGVESIIANTDVIVVTPDGGYDGFYSDWYGTDLDGHTPAPAPAWETFHIRELLPWVDAAYRTRADRDHRAVAGNSMGGFGAMSYAARHPELFVAAGAFSGAVNPLLFWPVGASVYLLAPNLPDQKAPDLCIWGDPITQYVRWADHNPTSLAGNLEATALYQRTGDGTPGRYDDVVAKQPSPGGVLNEFGINLMNGDFDRALRDAGIAHRATFEHGIHDWPYWLDDLREFLPIATAAFANPPAAPPLVPFDFTSGAADFSAWGWRFRPDHADQAALVRVQDVEASGLHLFGDGIVRVDTAPLYSPGATYVINGVRHVVDAGGRLHFDAPARPRGAYTGIVASF